MAHIVELSDEARQDLAGLRAFDRSAVAKEMLTVLSVNPTLKSNSRIKLLEQPAPTQYRLRVGDVRVFYDVRNDGSVWVKRVMYKEMAQIYGRTQP